MKLEPGYIAFNGHVFTAVEAAAYNRQCEETARAKLSGNSGKSVDFYLNQQNSLFKAIIGVS